MSLTRGMTLCSHRALPRCCLRSALLHLELLVKAAGVAAGCFRLRFWQIDLTTACHLESNMGTLNKSVYCIAALHPKPVQRPTQ